MAEATTSENAAPVEEEGLAETNWDRKRVAESIVNRHVALATGVAFVPSPLIDLAGLTAVQLNMIHRLSILYDISFTKEAGKNVLLALLGSWGPMQLKLTGVSMLKAIPGLGTVAGTIALPALSSATTFAVGRVMIRHYESGGNLLNLDARKAREYFKEQLHEGAPTAN